MFQWNLNLEMEEGSDDEFFMMFLPEDISTSPNTLVEPPQNLNGSSSPPPFHSVSTSFDSGELIVSSALIPNAPRPSKALSQTLEWEDGNGSTFKANIHKEDISLQGKISDVSPFISRDLEQHYENATKGNYNYKSSHSQKELHSMLKRMQKADSHTRDQAQRRIWGVNSCNGNQKTGNGKKSTKNWRVITPTIEAGRLPGQSNNSMRCKKEGTSKNLLSERQRRRKIKDKLYSLRTLVPNISKMDKASIVADAITYARELRRQVKEVETEVAQLAATKEAFANGLPTHHQVIKDDIKQMLVFWNFFEDASFTKVVPLELLNKLVRSNICSMNNPYNR